MDANRLFHFASLKTALEKTKSDVSLDDLIAAIEQEELNYKKKATDSNSPPHRTPLFALCHKTTRELRLTTPPAVNSPHNPAARDFAVPGQQLERSGSTSSLRCKKFPAAFTTTALTRGSSDNDPAAQGLPFIQANITIYNSDEFENHGIREGGDV